MDRRDRLAECRASTGSSGQTAPPYSTARRTATPDLVAGALAAALGQRIDMLLLNPLQELGRGIVRAARPVLPRSGFRRNPSKERLFSTFKRRLQGKSVSGRTSPA
jgi:hypothetical protein